MSSSPKTEFVNVAGRKTQVTIGGEGPPLVYLHSAAGEEWSAWHDALARRFKVYAPHAPGFALSEGLGDIDDIHDLTWHTVDLFSVLGVSRAPVVGFSLGAWLGVELAILRPQLVERLVMIAAAGLHLNEAPAAELFIDDLDRLRRLLFHDPIHPATADFFPASQADPRLLLWLRAREASARIGWNPYLHDPKLAGHLHRVNCPTLLIWGDDDRLIPPAHGRRYAKQIAGARLELIANCGHMTPFEATDRCAAMTLEFLK